MATTRKTKTAGAGSHATSSSKAGQRADAIALLKADHREVDGYFERYEGLTDDAEKKALADEICLALKVHTRIEEELFYPIAREKTGDGKLLDEAIVEHAGAKNLIAEIEAMSVGQPLYDAKVKVLGEQIRQHVEEEEQELFPEVRKTDIDLEALGVKLASRKDALMAQMAHSVTA